MTANSRRRQILDKFCARRYDTRENLATEFNVTMRTIERDILTLSLEYPIYTVQGNGGGIYVEEWYRQDGKYLTDEQSALLEELLPVLSQEKAAVMKSILEKFNPKRRGK